MLCSKVSLWFWRHLQTQFATQHNSFLKQLELMHLESDWLLLGSLDCVESPVEVRQDGVSVRGQGSNQSRTLSTPCADTYEFCSSVLAWLPFPSPLSEFLYWFKYYRREKCSQFERGVENGKKRKGGHLEASGMQSSHRWTFSTEGS